MTRTEIERKVTEFLVETLEIDSNLIKPDASLKEDIGLSSLDVAEIRLFILKTFGWQPTYEDMLSVSTMDDLISVIEQHLS